LQHVASAPPVETAGEPRAPRFPWYSPRRLTDGAPLFPLLVIFGLNAADELDAAAFNVLLPEIRDAFGLDNEEALTFVAFVAPVALLIGLPVAYYADRWRRTRLMAGGGSMWATFSFVTGMAPNLAFLGIGRGGASLGKAVNSPIQQSLLSDYYAHELRTKVYASHRAANAFGLILGPLLAGILGVALSWRAPFVLFAMFGAFFVVLSLRLREPTRGMYDRLAGGADADTAMIEEERPGFGDSWRLLHSIATLRRLYFALPLLAGALIGIQAVMSLFYDEVYGLNEVERGVLFAFDEVFALAGLVVGAPIATRIMQRDPGLALRFLGLVAVANATALSFVAASPNLGFAIGGGFASAFVRAVLNPVLVAVFSLTIPSRVRSMGFASFAVWVLPGLAVLPIVGGIGDDVGFRWAIMFLVPLYVLGAFVLSTGARSVDRDIENTRKWSALEAAKRKQRIEIREAIERGEVEPDAFPVLDVREIDFSYGQVQVLFDVSMQLHPGSRVALLGTNGAGKSTLLKVIAGLALPDPGTGGTVWWKGEDVTFTLAEERVRQGIFMIVGGNATFPQLTVEENLRLGAYRFLEDHDLVQERLGEVFEKFPMLGRRVRQRAGTLSGGEQQMMALGRALVAGPDLLIIDELSLGLAPIVLQEILAMVDEMSRRDTTLLVVEQSLNVAAAITDTALFMEKGEIKFSGRPAELMERGDLVRSVFFGATSS
jgi:ABC-type branched-subunit amino acid transport system ATPase component